MARLELRWGLAVLLAAALAPMAAADPNPPNPNPQGPNVKTNPDISGANTQNNISGPNTQQFMSGGNTQQYFSSGNSMPNSMPRTGIGQQNGNPITNQQPDSDGIFRSSRLEGGGVKPPNPTPGPAKSSPPPDEPEHPGDVTLEEARENIPGIVAAYLGIHSRDALYALDDPDTGGKIIVRFDSVDPASVRALGSGRFSAEARFHDMAGRKVLAEAKVDLSGNEWKVVSIKRSKPRKAFDAARCFSAAVSKRVRSGSKAGGPFVFRDDATARDWKLKLKRVHTERLAAFGQGGYYSCVDFLDTASRKIVDLDFYVSSAEGRCSVEQIIVHRIDGKARTIKPQAMGAQ